MKALLQRVRRSSVSSEGRVLGEIGPGLTILLGISESDTEQECDYLCEKAVNLRIFEDDSGKLNRSLLDTGGELLVVSQFTLYGDCKKGRRPSFIRAARPETAVPLYERFLQKARDAGISVAHGKFGADMLVEIENDGPVTLMLDTDEIMPRR